jgi:hypothetical protein
MRSKVFLYKLSLEYILKIVGCRFPSTGVEEINLKSNQADWLSGLCGLAPRCKGGAGQIQMHLNTKPEIITTIRPRLLFEEGKP